MKKIFISPAEEYKLSLLPRQSEIHPCPVDAVGQDPPGQDSLVLVYSWHQP
ncbi:MAG: hypothetical protein ABI760_09945 [Ferruginibacter sp.]